jgi:hypothetical protein
VRAWSSSAALRVNDSITIRCGSSVAAMATARRATVYVFPDPPPATIASGVPLGWSRARTCASVGVMATDRARGKKNKQNKKKYYSVAWQEKGIGERGFG